MTESTGEGLIHFRDGYANPIYNGTGYQYGLSNGDGYEWRGHFNGHNYEHAFIPIANGINVPLFNLSLNSLSDCYNVYCKCAPLQGILNKTAESLTNGKWKIVNEAGDDVSKRTTDNKRIVDMLRRPNPEQTYSEFLKTISLYRDIYGGCFLYAGIPSGFDSVLDSNAIHVFRPQEVEIVWKKNVNPFRAKTINDYILKYKISPLFRDIKPFEAKPQEVLFIYDTSECTRLFSQGLSDDQPTAGLRIKSLFYEIRNVMQAQEAVYSLNSDRGAQGIISNTAKDALGFYPMTKNEKERIENRMRSNYGMRREQGKIMVTDASIQYTQIGFNVKDLMLFEGVRGNIMHICDTYSYPFDLVASEKGKTAADKRIALETLYDDKLIPFSDELSEKIFMWMGQDSDKQRLQIDFSHLDIFQKGNVERNNSRRQLFQAIHIGYADDMITREEARREMGYEPKVPNNGTLRSDTEAASTRNDVRVTTS